MIKYVAMIRGVGPENPNMRGEKLRRAFEDMGFTNVRPFLSSGNVMFQSEQTNKSRLEKQVESALPSLLNFSRQVFIRSQTDLQRIVDTKPFNDLKHGNAGRTYLTVTFCKSKPKNLPPLPYKPEGKAFQLVANVNGAICSVVDLTSAKTPDLMSWLERHLGKEITTRTWHTISRLANRLDEL